MNLIILANRKLAQQRKVLTKKPNSNGIYMLLDIKTGGVTLMSVREVERLAREIGAVQEKKTIKRGRSVIG